MVPGSVSIEKELSVSLIQWLHLVEGLCWNEWMINHLNNLLAIKALVTCALNELVGLQSNSIKKKSSNFDPFFLIVDYFVNDRYYEFRRV